jgi:hypothetical protein
MLLAYYLSIYIASFFAIIDIENEFGNVLSVLLGTIIVVSSIWLVAGIKLISSWKKRYGDYIGEKQEIDRKVCIHTQCTSENIFSLLTYLCYLLPWP